MPKNEIKTVETTVEETVKTTVEKTVKTTVERLEEQHKTNIEAYNVALKEENLKRLNELDAEIKEIESEYVSEVAKKVYDECLATDNPMKTAITRYSFPILSHKDEKVDGIVTNRVFVGDRVKQLDLLELCVYSQRNKLPNALNDKWQFDAETLNQLLCMKLAKELGFKDKDIEKLAGSYFMSAVAKRMKAGDTPESNTQVCKHLQTVVDGILFEADAKGKNIYKCNNHDVAFLVECYARKGKNALSIKTAKHEYIRRLIADVMYRIVTKGVYTVEYKIAKGSK